jgi:hypothetical protein
LRKELFQPSIEGEARLLLLIDAFSTGEASLEGRTKLAKLDFFLRYPQFLARALLIRKPDVKVDIALIESQNIESRMVRYRYGPWDPAYFALIGRLVGKGLVQIIPSKSGQGLNYKTTKFGHSIAGRLAADDSWSETMQRVLLLKKHLNLNGTKLKEFIYQHFPEVTAASWGDLL